MAQTDIVRMFVNIMTCLCFPCKLASDCIRKNQEKKRKEQRVEQLLRDLEQQKELQEAQVRREKQLQYQLSNVRATANSSSVPADPVETVVTENLDEPRVIIAPQDGSTRKHEDVSSSENASINQDFTSNTNVAEELWEEYNYDDGFEQSTPEYQVTSQPTSATQPTSSSNARNSESPSTMIDHMIGGKSETNHLHRVIVERQHQYRIAEDYPVEDDFELAVVEIHAQK